MSPARRRPKAQREVAPGDGEVEDRGRPTPEHAPSEVSGGHLNGEELAAATEAPAEPPKAAAPASRAETDERLRARVEPEAAAELEPAADKAQEPGQPGEGERPSFYDRLWASGLLNVGVIARRELGAFFVSPIGYVVATVLVLPVSFLGYLARIGTGQAVTMNGIFSLVALLMVFFTPLYTMRLLAEERRSGTLEILLTSPVRDWEVVIGKWLGGLAFYLATIAFTLVYVVLISVYQPFHSTTSIFGIHLQLPNVDYGGIVAGYVGVILVGAAWVALGLLASSLTSNQIIAAVLGVGLLLAFQYLFGTLSTFLLPPYSEFFDYLSAGSHAQSFGLGRIVLRDVVYFLTLTAAALFITTRVVESRKWR